MTATDSSRNSASTVNLLSFDHRCSRRNKSIRLSLGKSFPKNTNRPLREPITSEEREEGVSMATKLSKNEARDKLAVHHSELEDVSRSFIRTLTLNAELEVSEIFVSIIFDDQ